MMNAATIAQARATLLRKPALINARAAALRAVQARTNCSPEAARFKLTEIVAAKGFRELFRIVMPEEFAKEEKTSALHIAPKFFKALGFPVEVDALFHCIAQGENPVYFSIPLEPLNPHICDGCGEFGDQPVIFQLALLFFHAGETGDGLALDDWLFFAEKLRLPEELRPMKMIDMRKLQKAFEIEEPPLKHMGLVFDVAEYNTKSLFYNFDPNDGPLDVEWSPANIKWLREDHKVAEEIDRKLSALYRWMKRHPRPRAIRALQVYHETLRVNGKPKAKSATRIAVDSGRALVRVL